MPNLDENNFGVVEALKAIDVNFQIGPQPVEALIPINPVRWPARVIATSMCDELRRTSIGDDGQSLFRSWKNIQMMFDYLSSSQSDAHYNERFGQVMFETGIVNGLVEGGGYIGQMIAGDYANEAAERYGQEIVNDELSPREDDLIAKSLRLRLRGGPGSKSQFDPINGTEALFDGTGAFKENLMKDARSNPITSLPTCRRADSRPLYTYKFFGPRGGAMLPVRCYYSYRVLCIINNRLRCSLCAIPSYIGAIFAGHYSNDMVSQYTDEIVQDELAKSMETQFSCEVRLRSGPGSKNHHNYASTPLFGGVGLYKEQLPPGGRSNLLFGTVCPRRNDRPIWSYKFFGFTQVVISPDADIILHLEKFYNFKIIKIIIDVVIIGSYIYYSIRSVKFYYKIVKRRCRYAANFTNKIFKKLKRKSRPMVKPIYL